VKGMKMFEAVRRRIVFIAGADRGRCRGRVAGDIAGSARYALASPDAQFPAAQL